MHRIFTLVLTVWNWFRTNFLQKIETLAENQIITQKSLKADNGSQIIPITIGGDVKGDFIIDLNNQEKKPPTHPRLLFPRAQIKEKLLGYIKSGKDICLLDDADKVERDYTQWRNKVMLFLKESFCPLTFHDLFLAIEYKNRTRLDKLSRQIDCLESIESDSIELYKDCS